MKRPEGTPRAGDELEFSRLFEITNDAFVIASPDGFFRRVNSAWTRLLGWTAEELTTKPFIEFVHPDDRERTLAEFAAIIEQGKETFGFINRYRHRDGSYQTIEWTASRAPDTGYVYATARDVSARKRAEDRFRRLVEGAPNAIVLVDQAGAITLFNVQAEALFGYSSGELVGKPIETLLAARFRDNHPALRDGFFADPSPRAMGAGRDLYGLHKDGREIRIEIGLNRIETEEGSQVLASVIDITERVEAARRIREYLDIAIDPLIVNRAVRDPDSGAIVDFEVVLANDPADRLVGKDFSAIGGRLSAQDPDLVAKRLRLWSDVVESGRPVEYDASLLHSTTGETGDLSVRITRVGDGVAVAFRDVTASKQLQRALESARAEAERARHAAESARAEADRANRSKTEFLSRMSHELRTPLNAVIGFAQLLELESLPDGQRDSVGHILRGGRHLLDLINEVLDISRIESGTLTISPEPVHVADTVTEAVALIAPLAEDRGIRVLVEDGDRHVLADRQRLKQVLLNLLSNAVKFNRPAGTITVSISEAVADRVRIAVHDEGGGIAAALRDRVFAPFDRLEAESTGVEGTGLGLPLSKALVERMGGVIGFDSAVGEGATFWIELPAATPAPEADAVEAATAGAARSPNGDTAGTVLYIEDNLSNLQLVERLFALRTNVRVIPAMLGRLGLDLAREHLPALVLLDLHLPDIAGDEVMARLRADPTTRDIPIVVLSADATPHQQERLLAAGAVAYLSKPIDVSEFLETIDRILAGGR